MEIEMNDLTALAPMVNGTQSSRTKCRRTIYLATLSLSAVLTTVAPAKFHSGSIAPHWNLALADDNGGDGDGGHGGGTGGHSGTGGHDHGDSSASSGVDSNNHGDDNDDQGEDDQGDNSVNSGVATGSAAAVDGVATGSSAPVDGVTTGSAPAVDGGDTPEGGEDAVAQGTSK